ncbi:HemK2/MTQ2 family protein methyltransferase [Streptomyces sp. NPDC008139]|uniref:HemK2/MTQ2 family protein methyltransferase n=1 Tax=Streptomyces sp. NPDC008139 TaxID=3364814 RepID=UPI0036EBAEFF
MPGVYQPQQDTHLLMRAMCREAVAPGMHVLDLCTGSGALAICAARLGARVTAVDIAWQAVLSARANALRAGRRVRVLHGDLAGQRGRHDRPYDLVVSNPPYVPSPAAEPPVRGAARSWDAGHDGRAVVDRICATAPRVLAPHGVLLMVHSALCGVEATLASLAEAGLRAAVTDRELIPFGPVLRERTAWLRQAGLIDGEQDKEELVVIRAEHA